MTATTEPRAYMVYWTGDRLRQAASRGWVGRPVPYLFGGPHTSHPSLVRYRVEPGDVVYPITLSRGRLGVLCRVVVGEVLSLFEFLDRQHVRDSTIGTATNDLQRWLRRQGLGWLAPTCTDDAAVVRDSSPLVLDRFLAPEQLAEVRLINAKGPRPLNNVKGGSLKVVASVSGHYYRLTADTARMFDDVLVGPPEPHANQPSLFAAAAVAPPPPPAEQR